MYLDIELNKKELRSLDEGGVIVMILPSDIRVTIKKDEVERNGQERKAVDL